MARLLQIFNCYTQPGGEETFVRQLQDIIGHASMRTLLFHARDWTGSEAPPRWKQAALVFSNPASVKTVLAEHAAFNPDAWLVGNLYPVASAAIYEAAHRRNIPIIHMVHNFRPFSVNGMLWANGRLCTAGLQRNFWPEIAGKSWRNSYAMTALLATVLWSLHRRGSFKKVAGWITVSEFMQQTFIRAGFAPDRVFALHPFWMARPSLPQALEEDFFFFIGRLIPEKGIDVLLRAWDHLHATAPGAPRLIIAGRGPLESAVRAAMARNPLIQYEGFVSDERKLDLIARCRAMVAPSVFWEPLGAVTYEAYESGKPMLGARSGGITETIQHNVTGLLHAPGNALELAAQVLEINADAPRRRQMGQAGRAWLLQHTAPHVFKNHFLGIVDKVLKQRT